MCDINFRELTDILHALEQAQSTGSVTIGLTGKKWRPHERFVRLLSTHAIHATMKLQEAHLPMCMLVERIYFGRE